MKIDERRSQRQVAAGAVFTRADKHLISGDNAIGREFRAMEQIGFLIGEGKDSQARRIYERHKHWMTLPMSALKILYPDN